MTPIQHTVYNLLSSGEFSSRALATALGYSIQGMRYILSDLQKMKLIRVAGWTKVGCSTIALWGVGTASDAKRPRALTAVEIGKRRKARRIAARRKKPNLAEGVKQEFNFGLARLAIWGY